MTEGRDGDPQLEPQLGRTQRETPVTVDSRKGERAADLHTRHTLRE